MEWNINDLNPKFFGLLHEPAHVWKWMCAQKCAVCSNVGWTYDIRYRVGNTDFSYGYRLSHSYDSRQPYEYGICIIVSTIIVSLLIRLSAYVWLSIISNKITFTVSEYHLVPGINYPQPQIYPFNLTKIFLTLSKFFLEKNNSLVYV